MRAVGLIGLAALVCGASPALSAPPPVGSEDWKIMTPYKDWVTSQHDSSGRWCCDIGDGRPVEAEIFANCNLPAGYKHGDCPVEMPIGFHYWVHITPEHFPDEPERWLMVPDEKIVEKANPVGLPIVWLYQGKVQCFAPPDGS